MKTSAMCTALILMTLIVTAVQAHPGRTASDGCHYCRTNCSDWGETAGTRHCHSGSNSTIIEELGSKKTNKETMVENHSQEHSHDHKNNLKEPSTHIES